MRIATIFISLLLISALFLTACQQPDVEDVPSTTKKAVIPEDTEPSVAGDVDIVAEDEVDIGELVLTKTAGVMYNIIPVTYFFLNLLST